MGGIAEAVVGPAGDANAPGGGPVPAALVGAMLPGENAPGNAGAP